MLVFQTNPLGKKIKLKIEEMIVAVNAIYAIA